MVTKKIKRFSVSSSTIVVTYENGETSVLKYSEQNLSEVIASFAETVEKRKEFVLVD